ncbi:MAG: Na+/H+ antiporter NhaC [Pseudohongiellaceae bacterium]
MSDESASLPEDNVPPATAGADVGGGAEVAGRQPGLLLACCCFFGVLLIIAVGLFGFGVDLRVLMFLCLLYAGVLARWLGYGYGQLREFMGDAIGRALQAIYIFILIGMVIASFMQSGTIAALMYYGLGWLSPAWFLPLGLVLCALMSVATGTSWGTVGTLGVVFVGMGMAMQIHPPLVAGMVVCGATFGDKMSPVSDTTNLAAMSAETNLYRHIYAMLFTTLPTFLLVLVLFFVLGLSYSAASLPQAELDIIRTALAENYDLQPVVTLLPLLLMLALSLRRVAAELTMAAGILLAVAVAVLWQGHGAVEVLNALWANSPGDTEVESLDELLGRGGISSMSGTLLLAIMALALGGILHRAGFLKVLLAGIIERVRGTAALLATTMGSGLIGNLAMGEAYISILLNCQLFRQKYQQQGLDKAMLSRSVEEGSTLTTSLIPWTTAGAFYAATLGVPVLDYLPYAFFNYLNGPLAVAMTLLGFGVLRQKASGEDEITS